MPRNFLKIPVLVVSLTALLIVFVVVAACGDDGLEITIGSPATAVPADAPAPTATPSPTPSPTPTPTASPTPTPTPSPTLIPTPTPIPLPTEVPTRTPAPTPSVPGASAATEPLSEAEQIYFDAADAMSLVDSFHYEMNATLSLAADGLGFTIPVEMTGDFQAPDRSQGSLSMNIILFQVETQFVNIGDTSYSTDPDTGEWTVGAANGVFFGDPADFADPEFLEAAGNFAELTIKGIDDLDGVEAYHLGGMLSAEEADATGAEDFATEFWIGVDDGLFRQVSFAGELDAEELTTDDLPVGDLDVSDAQFSAMLTFSDYNKPIEIVAPDLPVAEPPSPLDPQQLDSGWLRYELPEMGFTIALPPSWEATRLDPDRASDIFTAIEETNPLLATRVEDQILSLIDSDGFKIFAYDTDVSVEDTDLTTMNLVSEDAGFEVALDLFADLSVEQVGLVLEVDGEIQRTSVDIGGILAEELRYTMNAPDENDETVKLAVSQYLLVQGTLLWAVTLATPLEKSDGQLPIFEQIAQSVELTEPLDDDSTLGTENQFEEETPLAKSYDSPPAMTIDTDKSYKATFELEEGGEFVVELYAAEAPKTVNNFVFLARDGFYDGVTFHRVIPDFMAQGGDPTGTGSGGPGYRFEDEFHPSRRHDKPGILSMANAGPGTNGSQFFITFVPTPHLNDAHTVFGAVIEGMDVVNALTVRDPGSARTPGDAIKTIMITEE